MKSYSTELIEFKLYHLGFLIVILLLVLSGLWLQGGPQYQGHLVSGECMCSKAWLSLPTARHEHLYLARLAHVIVAL